MPTRQHPTWPDHAQTAWPLTGYLAWIYQGEQRPGELMLSLCKLPRARFASQLATDDHKSLGSGGHALSASRVRLMCTSEIMAASSGSLRSSASRMRRCSATEIS